MNKIIVYTLALFCAFTNSCCSDLQITAEEIAYIENLAKRSAEQYLALASSSLTPAFTREELRQCVQERNRDAQACLHMPRSFIAPRLNELKYAIKGSYIASSDNFNPKEYTLALYENEVKKIARSLPNIEKECFGKQIILKLKIKQSFSQAVLDLLSHQDDTRELVQTLIEKQTAGFLNRFPSILRSGLANALHAHRDQVHEHLTKNLFLSPETNSYAHLVLETSAAIAHIKLRCYAGELMVCEQPHQHRLKQISEEEYNEIFDTHYQRTVCIQELIETNKQCATMALALLEAQKK